MTDFDEQIESLLTQELLKFEYEKFSLPNIIPRSSYVSFYSSFSGLKNILTKYDVIPYLISVLKDNQQLFTEGFNLYPLFYQRLKVNSLCITNEKTDLDTNIHEKRPEPTETQHLYKHSLVVSADKKSPSIFGTYFLLEKCDIRRLSIPNFIANLIIPTSMETFSVSQIESLNLHIPIQSLLSLTGKSMFLGSFYPFVDCFDFKLDFLITTTRENSSTVVSSVLYDAINHHLTLMSNSMDIIILNLIIPNIITTDEMKNIDMKSKKKTSLVKISDKIEGSSLWTYKEWQSDILKSKELAAKLANLYINNGRDNLEHVPFIKVQAMVPIYTSHSKDAGGGDYHKILITYVPHSLQMKSNQDQGEIWSGFNNTNTGFVNDMLTSLFLKQAPAEAFMTLILHQSLSQTKISNSTETVTNSQNLKPSSKENSIKHVKPINRVFGIFKFPDNIPELINDEETANVPVKQEMSIWNQDISNLEKSLIENISKSNVIFDFFEILENVIHLVVSKSFLNTNKIDGKILENEIQNILKSSVYKLYHVIQSNIIIRELLYGFNEHRSTKLFFNLFQRYLSEIQNILTDISSKYNLSFIKDLEQKILSRASRLFSSENSETQIKEILKPMVMLELRYYNNLCYPLLWQMVGDYLLKLPCLNQLLRTIQELFPNISTKIKIQEMDAEFKDEEDFKAFFETKEIQNSLDKELDIITYLKTNNFIENWKDFLVELINKIENYSRINPFDLLCEQFNRASIKFDFEGSLKIETDYSSFQCESIDPDYFLYKVVNYEAYGLKSALMLLDRVAFQKLEVIYAPFVHKIYSNTVGLFQVNISTGMMGQLPYHGQVDPWVRLMDIVDNIYITGPDNCLDEASQIFAQIVIKHILGIKNSTIIKDFLIIGVYLPEVNQSWTVEEIEKNPRETMIQIAKCVLNVGSVYIRITIPFQWHYLSLIKHFRFHFINLQKTQYFNSIVSENRSIEIFRLVFFNRESAQLYLKNGGYLKSVEDPFSSKNIAIANERIDEIITKNFKNKNWINFYRALLTKSMINDNHDFIDESVKIFHGILGQLDYLNSLNKTMQNVIFYVLTSKMYSTENTKDKTQINGTVEVNNKNKSQASILNILNKTFRGYLVMLIKVFENKNLQHLYLKDVLLPLLNNIKRKDNQNKISINFNGETIIKLEQIRQILEYMECFYGHSCQNCCPNAFVHAKSIGHKSNTISVAMNETVETYKDKITLKMIKSDFYERWYTEPYYGCRF